MTKKIVKSDAEWRQELTPEQYYVTRQKGTERAFTGELCDNKESGVYRCVCCGSELFSSATKYDSRSGWPSFWQPVAADKVAEERDASHGMVRTEAAMQPMRRPPRPRLPRRPPADRPALLHELGVAQVRGR